MQDLLKRDAQASFRISAFRLQHQVDVRPDTESVQKFFELLLAEADLMQHARQEDLELGVLENGEAEGRKSAAIKQLGGPPNGEASCSSASVQILGLGNWVQTG